MITFEEGSFVSVNEVVSFDNACTAELLMFMPNLKHSH